MSSVWSQETIFTSRPSLHENMRTEVAIIGAGITGILLADRLRAQGKETIVLEANTICGGQTAGTTAKITAQHGLFYHQLITRMGSKRAALYAMGQRNAIAEYARLVRARDIACDFHTARAFLYSTRDDKLLRREAEAAAQLGFSAHFTTDTDLPFPVRGALYFEEQAYFQPLQFLEVLSRPLTIFEHTPVLSVEESRIVTKEATVTADYIVFACHFPFVNFPGLYFMRMHQERSHVLALSGIQPPQDLYYGIDPDGYSLRPYQQLLLFGGESGRTGTHAAENCRKLEQAAKMWYPDAKLETAWTAQDCIPARGLPYIGRFSQKRLNWFVATGYRKWGMTTAMAAAMLLGDMLCNRENPLEEVYTPDDFSAYELPQIIADGCRSVISLALQASPFRQKPARLLTVGEGAVTGVCRGSYRDDKRRVHTVSLRCPHLGCRLHFNNEAKTWDCPCHGSRFDARGRVISGPAQENISRKIKK